LVAGMTAVGFSWLWFEAVKWKLGRRRDRQ